MTTRPQDLDDEADALRRWRSEHGATDTEPVFYGVLRHLAIGLALGAMVALAVLYLVALVGAHL